MGETLGAPLQEMDSVPQRVNLDLFYQEKLAELQAEQAVSGAVAWGFLERKARSHFQGKLQSEDILASVRDQSEKAISVDKFQQLVDCFQSHFINSEQRKIRLPNKNLTSVQKEKILAEWSLKGWEGNLDSFTEELNFTLSWTPRLLLSRNTPLHLEKKHFKFIKSLITPDNDPVELAESLSKIGFELNNNTLESHKFRGKLKKLFNAPHAKEALEITQGISNWDKNQKASQIDFLIQLAQSENPKSIFSPETIYKIDIISRALGIKVGATDINKLQEIIKNPDYLDFAAFLSLREEKFSNLNGFSLRENIVALDEAGVLKPLVGAFRAGFMLDISSDSLRKIFNNNDFGLKQKKIQQEIISSLHDQLNKELDKEEVQNFLHDPKKMELAGLFMKFAGFPIYKPDELEKIFGENLSRGKEVIYILKLLQGGEQSVFLDMHSRYYLRNTFAISDLTKDPVLMDTFTDPKFSAFFQRFKSKTGYLPNINDFYSYGNSKLAYIFNNPEVRLGLLLSSTTEVIKAFFPNDGKINLAFPEYYIHLAGNPNMPRVINVLHELGFNLKEFFNRPEIEILNSLANSSDILQKLTSPESKNLLTQLSQEFKWNLSGSELSDFIILFNNNELRKALLVPENAEFIKKIAPFGFPLSDLKPILELDTLSRELILKLKNKFRYVANFKGKEYFKQKEVLRKLMNDAGLQKSLFSNETIEAFKQLEKNFGTFSLDIEEIEIMAKLPKDFSDFFYKLQTKNFSIVKNELFALLQFSLSADRERTYQVLDALALHGYDIFSTQDLPVISALIPYAESLSPTLVILSEVLGYKFLIGYPNYTEKLVSLLRETKGNLSKERLLSLEQIYNRYAGPDFSKTEIDWVSNAAFIEENDALIRRLEQFNFEFKLANIDHLRLLTEFPDKEKVFQVLNVLRENFPFSYDPELSEYYVKLAQIPNFSVKIRDAASSIFSKDLFQHENFRLFVVLGAEASLYNHARNLLSNEYFKKVRDAGNRFNEFEKSIYRGEIPETAVARIFALSQKPTELDKLILKFGISAEIAKTINKEDWHTLLLEASDFQEADKYLSKIMTELALPVVYADLHNQEFIEKQNQLTNLASVDKEFAEILEICCRSVGIYGRFSQNGGTDYEILMEAIKQSLELNLERNSEKYLLKRAELSAGLFERIFDGFSPETRNEVMEKWLDLSSRRKLRVRGDIVAVEELTLNRLERIKEIVQTDLSIHLQALFTIRIKELAESVQQGEADDLKTEQLAIYGKYLLTSEGTIRQDIPGMYRSIGEFIRSGQRTLRNPEASKEEKARLGKSLGTYQAISDTLRSLYKLSAISDERYKNKKSYLNVIDKNIKEFSGALKKLSIFDPEKRSPKVEVQALEEEVLFDLSKLKGTLAEEDLAVQTIFETRSTVSFNDLANAPLMTQSCQRLDEATSFNHAAYSRLLDASNEMIDVYEQNNGEKNRLARSFIELSRINVLGETKPRLAILLDRIYLNPYYQKFDRWFSSEIIAHMLDRIDGTPEVSLLFSDNRISPTPEIEALIKSHGCRMIEVSGNYFINESRVLLYKYYDSMGGLVNVDKSSLRQFAKFHLIEKE